MADNKYGQANGRHSDIDPSSRMDFYERSESPRTQQNILYLKLKEEISSSLVTRQRYAQSKLHFFQNQRSPTSTNSEVQSTTLNIGLTSASTKSKIQGSNNNLKNIGSSPSEKTNPTPGCHDHHQKDPQCNVCSVKEVKENLMNINKILQDRNEQISKLKAKYLRSYFERQMADRSKSP